MRNQGLGLALQGLTGLAQGYMGQQEKNLANEQAAKKLALEELYRQNQADLQNKQFNLEQEKFNQQYAPQDLSWATQNDAAKGLFLPGEDVTKVNPSDLRVRALNERLSRDPNQAALIQSQIAENQAQAKKINGEAQPSAAELANLNARTDYLRAQAKTLGQVDPNKARLLSAQADAIERKLNAPSPGRIGPGQKSADMAFGKDYADYYAGGGRATTDKGLAALEDAAQKLESGQAKTGGLYGILPASAKDYFDPQSAAVQQQVEQAVQSSLKQTLGAQFTEKEGQQVMARAFNPRLSPQENAKRIRAEAEKIRSMAEDKDAAAQYFEQYGTLSGFRPTHDRRNYYGKSASAPSQQVSTPSAIDPALEAELKRRGLK